MNNMYNSYFFNEFYQENGGGNYTDTKQWIPFFEMIAEKIIEIFNPKTVLDAGCACGYLVAALRDKGVEAFGIDISEYAISNAREDIKPFLNVQSITDKLDENFPEKFDLVVTIEVLEHLFPEEGKKAIELLCSYSDTVLFTSTPTDIEDKTHVNVQQKEYWAKLFAEHSFYRDLYQPVDFICGWAMLFRKRDDISKVIFEYELSNRVDAIKTKKELFKCYYRVEGMDSYSEEVCKALYYHHGQKCIEVEIRAEKQVVGLRIDPMECNCIIKHFHVFDLLNDRNELLTKITNGLVSGSRLIFENNDPMLEIEVPRNEGFVKFEVGYEIEYSNSPHIFDTFHMLSGERKYLNRLYEEQKGLLEKLEVDISNLKIAYEGLQNEKERILIENAEYQKENNFLNSQIMQNIKYKEELENQLELIRNALDKSTYVVLTEIQQVKEKQEDLRVNKAIKRRNWVNGGRK